MVVVVHVVVGVAVIVVLYNVRGHRGRNCVVRGQDRIGGATRLFQRMHHFFFFVLQLLTVYLEWKMPCVDNIANLRG